MGLYGIFNSQSTILATNVFDWRLPAGLRRGEKGTDLEIEQQLEWILRAAQVARTENIFSLRL